MFAIDNGHPRNAQGLYSWNVIAPYTKEVVDPEQFIPLFACTPRLARQSSIYTLFYSAILPNTSAFINKFASPIRFELNNLPYRLCSSSSTSVRLINGNVSLPQGRFITDVDPDKLVPREFGGCTLADYDALAAALVKSISTPEMHHLSVLEEVLSEAYLEQDFSWSYGIWADNRIGHRTSTHRTVIEQTVFNLISEYTTIDSLTYYKNWLYLGQVHNLSRERAPLYPGLNDMVAGNFSFSGNPNVAAGVTSLYCVVVKAKHRPLIWRTLYMGEGNSLMEIPKGDLQLWQDENIKDLMSGPMYDLYLSLIYNVIRHDLQCPVRSFSKLSKVLFDVPDFTFNSAEDIEAAAKAKIEHVKSSRFSYHSLRYL